MKIAILWISLFCSLCLALAVCSRASAKEPTPIRAFKDWKTEKIQRITNKISVTRILVESAKRKKGSDILLQKYEKIMSQEEWNLEVAEDLSVTDYLVLYLALQPEKNRFEQAAAQLSPPEIAELMEAYANTLGVQAISPVVNTASGASQALPAQAVQRH